MLAYSHASLGQFEAGYQVLEDYLDENPDNWYGYYALGNHLTRWDRLDEALESLEKASSLQPGDYRPRLGLWRVFALRKEWDRAEAVALQMTASSSSYSQWIGLVAIGRIRLYQGLSRDALDSFAEAAQAYPFFTPGALCFAADVLLQVGQADRAFDEATAAQRTVSDGLPLLKGQRWWLRPVASIFPAIVSLAHQGRLDAAELEAEEFRRKAESLPTERELRRYHHISGEIELARDNATPRPGGADNGSIDASAPRQLLHQSSARSHLVLAGVSVSRFGRRREGIGVAPTYHGKHDRTCQLAYPLRPQFLLAREDPREPR